MRKKRKRTSLRPKPFLWIFLVANIALGLCLSSITSAVRVRADGVAPFDQNRILGILKTLRGQPCYRVDARALESKVMALPEVDRAELTRNIFGSALLVVRYRTPAAVLENEPLVALSSDGVIYKATELPPGLPTLQMPPGSPPTMASFADNWQPQTLATLAQYGSKKYPKTDIRIEVNRRGVVCLNIGSGRVIFGSCDDLDLKLRALESLLQKNPDELNEVQEVNLTLPSIPAVVPKKGGIKQ